MSSTLPEKELDRWKALPRFAVEISNRPTLFGKVKLILDAVTSFTAGDGMLWLLPDFLQIPLPAKIEGLLHDPTPAMQKAFETGQIIRDHDCYDPRGGQTGCLALPLLAQENVIGVLQVERPSDQLFSEDDCNYLQAMASQAAFSIQMSQQIEIDNWRFEQLSLVRSVTFQIANVLDLDELTRRITRLILHTFNYYYVAIFTVESGQDLLQFRANIQMGIDQETAENSLPGVSVHLGEGIVGYVAEKGEELLASNIHQEPHFRYVDSLAETQSEIAIPLKVENKVLGVLDVQSDQIDAFHDMDLLVLRALSDSIAVAIEHARSYSLAQKRNEQIATVIDVSRAIVSILDLDVLLSEIVSLIHKSFGYPFVHLFIVDQERQSVFFRAGSGARSEAMQKLAISYHLNDPIGLIPTVARSGKPIIANNVNEDIRYRPSFLNPTETKSEMALPLIFNKNVLGVLDLQSDSCNVFTAEDLSLLEALSAHIAISIRNASLYHSESWRRQAAESLRDITGNVSRKMDVNELLQIILAEVQRSIPSDVTGIWLIDKGKSRRKQQESFHLAAIRGIFAEGSEIYKNIDGKNDIWLAHFLQIQDSWVRTDHDPIGPLGKLLNLAPDYSSITVPLRSNGLLIGFLAIAHQSEGIYGTDEREMMAFFAAYVSIIIENSQLLSEAQGQARISTSLLQISQETQTLTTLADLAEIVIHQICSLIGVRGCAFYTWNETMGIFELINHQGIPFKKQSDETVDQVIPVGKMPAFDRLHNNKESISVNENELSELITSFEDSKKGSNLFMLIPLLARSELLGTFLISFLPFNNESITALNLEEEQLSVIKGISQQTAIAMDNIRLLEASQEEAYANAVLLQIAQAIVGADNFPDMLEAIVHILPILIGIDSSIIYAWDENQQQLKPGHLHLQSQEAEDILYNQKINLGEFSIIDQLWQEQSPKIIAYKNDDLFPLQWLSAPYYLHDLKEGQFIDKASHLLLGFPISIKEKKFGLFFIEEADHKVYRDDKRLDILSGIVQQVSLAFQNDYLQKQMVDRERFEQEIHLAHEIQKTFLPLGLPDYADWDFDVSWQPAYQVGGDFYDYFELPNHRLGLVIADVSDKGLPAALYMTVARTLIRATIQETFSPQKLLEHVNDLLLLNSHEGLFITAFYGILDLSSGDLVYASAGHNLPLVWRKKSQSIECLAKGGPALGIMGEAIHLHDFCSHLEPDDFLVLYTDGVTEAFSPKGELYGEDRLSKMILGSSVNCASELTDEIIHSVNDFSEGSTPSDDVTIFAIHRLQEN